MNGKAILVTVMSVKPGFEDLLISELVSIIEATRQIDGCLAFDLYRLSENRLTLILHEIWITREALEAYALSPQKTELVSVVTRSLAQPMHSWAVEEVCLQGR